MSEDYTRPCNCNWEAGCGPNLLCPVHGNKHHMAAKIAELEAQSERPAVTDEQMQQAIDDARTYGAGWLTVSPEGAVRRLEPNFVLDAALTPSTEG